MNSEKINTENIPIKIASNLDELTEEINCIVSEQGIIVKNIVFPIKKENIKKINMSEISSGNLQCGKIIDNINLAIKQSNDNLIIVCDFSEIKEISENFCKLWAKLLLETKAKIIPINMSIWVSTIISNFIENNFISVEE